MSRASTQPRVEYVCGLLQDEVAGIARAMQHSNQHEITKLNEKIAAMTDGVELADLGALKEWKIDKRLSAVCSCTRRSTSQPMRSKRMFDARDSLVELAGVLLQDVQQRDTIDTACSYGSEMYVLTILQRAGDVAAGARAQTRAPLAIVLLPAAVVACCDCGFR